jgi:integrase/recombinase XerD
MTTPQPSPRPPQALADLTAAFLDHLAVERGVAPNTVAAYQRDLKLYMGFLGVRGLEHPSKIGAEDVRAFLESLRSPTEGRRTYSDATVARVLAAVRGFHRYCVREGAAPEDPTGPIGSPRAPRSLPKALSQPEMTRLLAAVEGDGLAAQRDRAILETLYAAGLRISELTALDIGDVDLRRRTVRCVGKGARERVVPIGEPAAWSLGAYLTNGRPQLVRGREEQALFVNARGRRLTRQGCWKLLGKYVKHANLRRRISPHTLRHSFATHLLNGGADIREVQELLGHAGAGSVTRLVSFETLRSVYDRAHPRARNAS